jgi:hypothetical protein
MEYEECWSVVRVVDERAAEPREGFAAARFGRGGAYGRRWQIIGWLQERATDYDQAYRHGVSVKGERTFATELFPALRRRG